MYICKNCGKEITVPRRRLFCCETCYHDWDVRSRRENRADPARPTVPACKFNEEVLCPPVGNCKKCGWNPEVSQARIQKYREKQVDGT